MPKIFAPLHIIMGSPVSNILDGYQTSVAPYIQVSQSILALGSVAVSHLAVVLPRGCETVVLPRGCECLPTIDSWVLNTISTY
jgi:hypothetical protein